MVNRHRFELSAFILFLVILSIISCHGLTSAAPTPKASSASPSSVPNERPAPQSSATDQLGILFGQPIVQSASGMTTVLVLVTNTTEMVKTFSVKATFESKGTAVAAARGAVNQLLPGEQRAVDLLSIDQTPARYDRVQVAIDRMISANDTSSQARVAQLVTFGVPSVSIFAGLGTVSVAVTNGDTVAHSYQLHATFLEGNRLVTDAVGAVSQLPGRHAETVSLYTTGKVPAYDHVVMSVDKVTK